MCLVCYIFHKEDHFARCGANEPWHIFLFVHVCELSRMNAVKNQGVESDGMILHYTSCICKVARVTFKSLTHYYDDPLRC